MAMPQNSTKKSKRLALVIYLLVLTALYLLLALAANAEAAARQVCPDCIDPVICTMVPPEMWIGYPCPDPNTLFVDANQRAVEPNQPPGVDRATEVQLERLRFLAEYWLRPYSEVTLSNYDFSLVAPETQDGRYMFVTVVPLNGEKSLTISVRRRRFDYGTFSKRMK